MIVLALAMAACFTTAWSVGSFQTCGLITAWLKSRQMKTSPMRESANSSSQRARARSATSRG